MKHKHMHDFVEFLDTTNKSKPHWAYKMACIIKNREKQGYFTQRIVANVKVDPTVILIFYKKLE